jgi:2-polyprenyl-6-methoxyphenol hydroxylase-like FAD-dependent oxidoreductase
MVAAMIDPDVLMARLDAAVERGDMTEEEARDEYEAAREEAMQEMAEEWR